jgi:leucyl aminopeptidase
MNLDIKEIRETHCACDALILPVTEGDLNHYYYLGSKVSSLIKKLFSKEFLGRQNELLFIPSVDYIKSKRILFIGLGKKDEVSSEKVRQAGGKAVVYLRDKGMKKVALSAKVIESLKLSPVNFIEGALLGLYTFKKYRKVKNTNEIGSITVISKTAKELNNELKTAKSIASSVNFARDLINTPSNDMTPTHLADAALSLKRKNLSVRVFEKKDVQKLGMGAYLSVAKGSKELPKFIVLKYRGGKGDPLVLIGKSITFDSGGEGMEKMKYDMAGGAAVLGVIKAVSDLKLRINVFGILPAAENLPGGSASKPGDIVSAVNKKTVEIINTDAEGRLIIADAIGYARRLKPRAIIDIATLTGACSIALGNEAIAMMGNNRELINKIIKSADKTDIADIKNSGGKNGSLVTSAYFLYEFTGQVPWVHLDIAGTAWTEKARPYIPKGASGTGVRLLLNLIKELE